MISMIVNNIFGNVPAVSKQFWQKKKIALPEQMFMVAIM